MDNREDTRPKESKPSSLESNPSPIPDIIYNTNSNTKGNNHPPSRLN